MELVLVEPEIPQNTGNIARTAAVTGCRLTLVRPLGFSLADRFLKRAGLDYLNHMEFQVIDDLDNYLLAQQRPFYFFSTKGKKRYCDIAFPSDSLLIFGSESKGLDKKIHMKYAEHFCTIPMKADVRSLNLSNAVAIALYEALRQNDFTILQ